VVNVNNDLTIPQYRFNTATVFAGNDGIMNTSDDVRPFNNFLQQQTTLNINGMPLWVLPDVYTDTSLVETNLVGDSLTLTVKVVNQGDAPIGSPVYASVYKQVSPQTFGSGTFLVTDSVNIQLLPGDTAEIVLKIPDIAVISPADSVVVRLNDKGAGIVQPEWGAFQNVVIISGGYLSDDINHLIPIAAHVTSSQIQYILCAFFCPSLA
jgi:hypothetical protein